jgi:molybdopterin-guanine dinucleotide biosynthesis protein B
MLRPGRKPVDFQTPVSMYAGLSKDAHGRSRAVDATANGGRTMRVFGLAGWSGSGKTTLVMCLLPELIARGVSVSTLKHTHHNFDIDRPGKDSYVHREAGAHQVMLSSGRRWALMQELRGAPEPSIAELAAQMDPVDLLLVEGFKRHPHPKIEVYRPIVGKPALYPDNETIVAVASDAPVTDTALPTFALSDTPAIASFILESVGLAREAPGADTDAGADAGPPVGKANGAA